MAGRDFLFTGAGNEMKSGTIAMSVVCAFHVLGLYYSWLIRTAAPGTEYYWLSSFSDDFFYYTQIARNIVEHGTSTFDGITRTNGYQPLWAVILFGLAHMLPVDQSPFYHVVFWVEIALCAFGTLFMRRLMREFNSDSARIAMRYTSGLLVGAVWKLRCEFRVHLEQPLSPGVKMVWPKKVRSPRDSCGVHCYQSSAEDRVWLPM